MGVETSPLYMLSGEFLIEVEGTLEHLLSTTGATGALLLDRSGCIMASAGNFSGIDPETLGATAAGILGALGSMVGRQAMPEVSLTCMGGAVPDHFMFFRIDDRLNLCLVDKQEVTLAAVRERARDFITDVRRRLEADRERSANSQTVVESVSFIESKLNELFRDYKPGGDI